MDIRSVDCSLITFVIFSANCAIWNINNYDQSTYSNDHKNYTISVISRHHGTTRQRNGVWKRADVTFCCSVPPSTQLIWSRRSGKILVTGNTVFTLNGSNSNVDTTINSYTLPITNVKSAVDAQTYTCVVIVAPDEHSADLVVIGK